jgi:hypothetical protein
MARKTVLVSDLTGKELAPQESVRITVNFADTRRGVYVLDAHPDDPDVKKLIEKGTKQARRGRKPKST